MKYVIARTFKRRPTLMHTVDPFNPGQALCGHSLLTWSRSYFDRPIDNLHCLRCASREKVINS